MSDDIELLGDTDDVIKQIKAKTQGLKKVEKAITDVDKQEQRIFNLIDQQTKRRQRTKHTIMYNALRSAGVSPSKMRGIFSKIDSAPIHAAYSMLQQQGATQSTLSRFAGLATGQAATHIAQQRNVYNGNGQAGPNLPMINMQAQMAQNKFMYGPTGIPQASQGGGIGDALNKAIPGIRDFTAAIGTAVVSFRGASEAAKAKNKAEISLSDDKAEKDRIASNLSSITGISKTAIMADLNNSGSRGVDVVNSLISKGTEVGGSGMATMMYSDAMTAAIRGQDSGKIGQFVGAMNTVGLSNLSRLPMSEGAQVQGAKSRAANIPIDMSKYASGENMLTDSIGRLNTSTNSITGNMVNSVLGDQMQSRQSAIGLVNGYGMDGSEGSIVSPSKYSPRQENLRGESFNSQQGRGGGTVYVDKLVGAPQTNPLPAGDR